MRLGRGLQEVAVHGVAHHDRRVDRLEGLRGRRAWERLDVQVGEPVDVLQERIGGVPELLGGLADLVAAGSLINRSIITMTPLISSPFFA